jgi:glycosyltransferase involved in cell wall biosynthesis
MITVLMPAHKYHKWLEAAIESVLDSETEFRFELIVLANNMSDKDLQKLEEFSLGKRIRVLKLGTQSLSQCLNEGLIQSKYEFVARFDSDDYMHKDRLQIQTTFLIHHPSVSVLASGVKLINALGETTGSRIPPLTHREIKYALRYGNCLVHPSIMFRRAAVLQVGGYTDNYSYAEDFDLYTRMINEYEFRALKMQLTSYRVFPDQISSKHSEIQLSSSIEILTQISKKGNRFKATRKKLNISVLKLRQKKFEHGTGSLCLALLLAMNLLLSPIATFHFVKYSLRNFHS